MMTRVRVLLIRAPGTNCDMETEFAFQQAGATTRLVHVNRLIRHEEKLSEHQILVIPGGFTYGDDISAGKILANEIKLKLGYEIRGFVDGGGLVFGVCNGFQTLVKAGILPGFTQNGRQPVTLTNNDSGKFECRWIHLVVNRDSPCVFTRGMDRLYLPVNHGEGKFIADPEILPQLNPVLYYADENGDTQAGYPHNPNGSMNNIAGICDATGRIFALMPHPERHIRGTQHPRWTRLGAKKYGDGFQIFLNAVKWAEGL
jgi:phosphoribosylformylglycinamidine synthase I